jgi:hypothetical protein
MSRVRGLTLFLSLSIPGCTFDLTDIAADTPARLTILIIANARTDQLGVSAALSPGRDSDANIRTIVTDLLVADRPLASSTGGPDGVRTYAAEWSLSAELPSGGSIVIRAPEIVGIPSTVQTFDVVVPMQLGPDSIFVSAGDAVVLQVTPPIVAAARSSWQLELIDSTGARFSMRSTGYPPEQIVVPRSWLSPGSSVYEAQLVIAQSFSSELVPGQYSWNTSVTADFHWTVVLTGGT